MLRDVDMQDTPAIMTDDKKAAQEAECEFWRDTTR
jgi:hypothetical protein